MTSSYPFDTKKTHKPNYMNIKLYNFRNIMFGITAEYFIVIVQNRFFFKFEYVPKNVKLSSGIRLTMYSSRLRVQQHGVGLNTILFWFFVWKWYNWKQIKISVMIAILYPIPKKSIRIQHFHMRLYEQIFTTLACWKF